MSTLDTYFGPRPDTGQGQRSSGDELLARSLQVRTGWRCEDAIKSSLTAFFDAWPDLLPRGSKLMPMHYAACRVVLDEVGGDEVEAAAFITWAADHIHKHAPHLSIKTGRSLLFLLSEWRTLQQAPGWQRQPCALCYTFHTPGECPDD
jgi:hypothetical protein